MGRLSCMSSSRHGAPPWQRIERDRNRAWPALQLVVDDAETAREGLLARGVEVGEVQEFPWGRFVFFNDPYGNVWSVQQLPHRSAP